MRQKHFEAIVAVQDRHIRRLEKMVEELFNVLKEKKDRVELIDTVPSSIPDEEPEVDVVTPDLNIMPGSLFTDQ